jgi:hypothetical protein
MPEFRRFLGIETGEKARKLLLWASPYLAMFLAILLSLSYLVQRFIAYLPLWMHAVAIICSLAAFLMFVGWGRRMVMDALEGRGEDSAREEP